MISLIAGKIGSGKTLRAVRLVAEHLAKGGTVATNVAFVAAEVERFCRYEFRVRVRVSEQILYLDLVDDEAWHDLIPWGTPELPVLVVLDEIHLFFNSRDWMKTQKLHRSMLSFLSQSRKACVDVIFIAQVASTLEKQFRVQCEWEFYCRSLRDISLPFVGRLPFSFMLLVQKDVETDKAMNRKFVRYDKRLFPLYDTRAMLDGEMRSRSETVNRVEKIGLERVPWIPLRVKLASLVALVLGVSYYFATS